MNFKEYIIKRKKGAKEITVSVLLYIAATILSLVFTLLFLNIGFSQLAALSLFGFYYLAYRLSTNMNKEFEYAFSNDLITVDVIMNKSRRKRLISFTLSDAEIIAAVKDSSCSSYLNGHFDKVIDAASHGNHSDVYFAVISGEKQTLLKFEPPHSALDELYRYAPSKVKIYD